MEINAASSVALMETIKVLAVISRTSWSPVNILCRAMIKASAKSDMAV